MNVTWCGTFSPGFSRNRKLRRLLELGGHVVREVNEQPWPADLLDIFGGGRARLLARAMVAYVRLMVRLIADPAPDVYLVSYPGWFDVPIVKAVAWLKRKPVVFDPFVGLYETVVEDRRLATSTSLTGRIASIGDSLALACADVVLADTPQHAVYYESLAASRRGTQVLWIGADDELFSPRAALEPSEDRVLFYGTFIGLQGVPVIVRAAKLLEDTGIRFRLIGDGQEGETVRELIDELAPRNLEWLGRLPLDDLPKEVAEAAVCLGVFGSSEKADRVIPHKVFECVAMARPVITGDTTAVRESLPGAVETCPVDDPAALSALILDICRDPERRKRMSKAARTTYLDRFHEAVLSDELSTALVVGTRGRPVV